jgi:hypothetical protein
VESHPGCAVRLLQKTPAGQWIGPIEDTDIIQAKEATMKQVVTLGVLAVDPPGEIEEQLLEYALQEGRSG